MLRRQSCRLHFDNNAMVFRSWQQVSLTIAVDQLLQMKELVLALTHQIQNIILEIILEEVEVID